MSPIISWYIITQQSAYALTLLMIASITDLLDGHIARKYSFKTKLGSFLDPIADKILVTTLVFSLLHTGSLSIHVGSIIILRDVLLFLGVSWFRLDSLQYSWSKFFNYSLQTPNLEEIQPPLISKVNTFAQLLYLILLVSEPTIAELELFLK
jgi:cardiolipin synthase